MFVERTRGADPHQRVGGCANGSRIACPVPTRTRGSCCAWPRDRTTTGGRPRRMGLRDAVVRVAGPRPRRLVQQRRSTGVGRPFAHDRPYGHRRSRRHEAAPEPCVPGWTKPRARGPGDCGEFASALRCDKSPGAASSQPPHMSISQSISRTTSFPVYERRYPRAQTATTDFRRFSAQRSLMIAASTSSAISPDRAAAGKGFPSSVCTRAASVMLDTSQTPCAAYRSAGRSGW